MSSEIEIQEQLLEVHIRNTNLGEQRALQVIHFFFLFFLFSFFFIYSFLQEEAQYDVLVAEVELITERMKEEKEKMKEQELEEKKVKELLTNAQVKERMLHREGIFFSFSFPFFAVVSFHRVCFIFYFPTSFSQPSPPPSPLPPTTVSGGASKENKKAKQKMRQEIDALEELKDEENRNLGKIRATKRNFERDLDAVEVCWCLMWLKKNIHILFIYLFIYFLF